MSHQLIDADRVWVRDLDHVFRYGNRVSPRGQLVFEVLALQSKVSMQNPIIYNELRNLGYRFMAAEAAWIISGKDDVKSIAPYSKDISKFSDDGETFFGAYGPKIREQLDYVTMILEKDEHTRQAVINIWRESPPESRDIPCTLSLQWLVRHDVLHCVATMRSSDLWLGHPYDTFNFSALSFYIMLHMNLARDKRGEGPLSLGELYLTAGSKHLYERNAADVGMIIGDHYESGHPYPRNPIFTQEYLDPDEFVMHLWDCADSTNGIKSMGG